MTSTSAYLLVPAELASSLQHDPELLRSIVYEVDGRARPGSVRSFWLDRVWPDVLAVLNGVGLEEASHSLAEGGTRLPDDNLVLRLISAEDLDSIRGWLVPPIDALLAGVVAAELHGDDGEVLEGEWLAGVLDLIGKLSLWLHDQHRSDDHLLIVCDG